MDKDSKKQLFAVFVLLMFVGSSIAYAFFYVTSPANEQPQKKQYTFNRPLSSAEEAEYLRNNNVILKFFTSEQCGQCKDAEQTVDEVAAALNEKLVVEKIDIYKWNTTASESGIVAVPTIYLKGIVDETINGTTDYDTLLAKACDLYFKQISEC